MLDIHVVRSIDQEKKKKTVRKIISFYCVATGAQKMRSEFMGSTLTSFQHRN